MSPAQWADAFVIALVVAIIEAMKRVRGGRLNDRAIIILLSHITGLGQREIKVVLDGIESMSTYYLKAPK